jgi:hypothetical protein
LLTEFLAEKSKDDTFNVGANKYKGNYFLNNRVFEGSHLVRSESGQENVNDNKSVLIFSELTGT